MKEKIFSKGNISLFALTCALTLIAGFVCIHFGAERVTTVAVSAMAGVATMLGIGGLFEAARMAMPVGPEAGVLGTLVGTAVMLFVA